MGKGKDAAGTAGVPRGKAREVLAVFLRLGLTSFGGPIAHLGYFHDEFVVRRRWLDEKTYADLVALCQFLPGPASSQVGIAIGLSRAGYLGSLAAWFGFTLPSAVALVLFAYGVETFGGALGGGWLHGLKVVAVAVVAQAVLAMMRSLAPDRERATLAVVAAALVLTIPSAWGQIGAIVLGAAVGLVVLRGAPPVEHGTLPHPVSRNAGLVALVLFFALLLGLPLLAAALPSQGLTVFEAFYRAGSLVFGGGHVVLPLLQAAVVPPGWVTNDAFLAGYGAAQAFVHVCRLSRRGHEHAAQRLGRRPALSRRHLPAVVPARHRRASILGCAAQAPVGAIGLDRGQRRGGWAAAGGSLSAGMDRGHHQCRGFCAGGRGISAAVHVADAALARGHPQRGG